MASTSIRNVRVMDELHDELDLALLTYVKRVDASQGGDGRITKQDFVAQAIKNELKRYKDADQKGKKSERKSA
jgi:hypothetical protein